VNLVERYVGNPDVYAVQNPDGKGYRPVREPLTDELLDQHIAGVETIGTYVLRYDKARFFVFDIDDGSLLMATRLAAACKRLGFHPGIEHSGRKGYHVWVLLGQWFPAKDVRLVAKYIARVVGFNGEVFPKQDVAVDLGNLIKLPQGVHKATGKRSRWMTPVPSVTSTFPIAVAIAEAAAPPPPKYSFGVYPCLESIQNDPPTDGERNDLMFHFAAHMRRAGLEGDNLEAACYALNNTFEPPLDDVELDEVIRNSEGKGPLCGQLSPKRHCGDKCLSADRRGLQVRPAQARGAADGEYLVVQVEGHVGEVLVVSHPDFAAPVEAELRKENG